MGYTATLPWPASQPPFSGRLRGRRDSRRAVSWMAAAEGPREHHHDHPGGGRGFRFGDFWDLGGSGFGGFGPRRGRRRVRRGDVRAATLLLLEEQPRNGYQIIQELTERTEGVWRPSPGSVYPVLQQLEDEGLVAPEGEGGGRTFRLTEAGAAYVEEHRAELGTPWEAATGGVSQGSFEFVNVAGQVAAAVRQVLRAGTDAQIVRATAALSETRRALYRILAEDPSEPEGHTGPGQEA